MAIYRDHHGGSSSKSRIFLRILTSISKNFERISTIVFSCNTPDRLHFFRGRVEQFLSDTAYIATRLRTIRTHSPDTAMIWLLLLFLVCLFVYHVIRSIFSSPDRDAGGENYRDHSSGRTTLYCETCYLSCYVDSNGWCHKCARFSLHVGIFLFADYVTNTIPARDYI